MQIGLMGLGKMGENLAFNMQDHGFEVIAYNRSQKPHLEGKFPLYHDVEAFVKQLKAPRTIWIMLTAGSVVDQVIETLVPLLDAGDTLIDGGNSRFSDTVRRYESLKEKQIAFIDCGTSGGTEGARHGANLMVGGTEASVTPLKPLFDAVALKGGVNYVNQPGGGHYVKMIHNAIEYGMMQAIAEGLDVLERSPFDVNLVETTRAWNEGSIIESYLVGITHDQLKADPALTDLVGKVDESGEAKWTVEEAIQLGVDVPVIATSLFNRFKSKDERNYREKVLAAMRNGFGGHAVHKK
jgi:6-phosphogluconate dehydrogenase